MASAGTPKGMREPGRLRRMVLGDVWIPRCIEAVYAWPWGAYMRDRPDGP